MKLSDKCPECGSSYFDFIKDHTEHFRCGKSWWEVRCEKCDS